jgi:hypothetical protein
MIFVSEGIEPRTDDVADLADAGRRRRSLRAASEIVARGYAATNLVWPSFEPNADKQYAGAVDFVSGHSFSMPPRRHRSITVPASL